MRVFICVQNRDQQAKTSEQNAGMKRQISEANATILKMGLMFLKMKFSRSQQSVTAETTTTVE